ncbi:extracellular catalytic domain type 1 short-chain-length polyhydroxyalkanoate depolymerase [Actinomadura scrupuli]|uniref:extracellular catalytic domain type 1 short-chain-length polyhydroxyalkanoate depolymerase n=1 Tax=Actinomadura scrupuli TaxID=559629 RepID=UPI003D99A1EB
MRLLAAFVVALIATAFPVSAAGADPALTRHTFTNAAGSRDYLLYVPPGSARVPLIVFLHGCGAAPDAYGLQRIGEARGFAVALPIESAPGGCWNWQGDRHRDAGEPSLIAGITREAQAEHPIDPDRTYIAGHSAGSGMTANLAAAYPDLYAAAGLVAGCGLLSCADVTGQSAFREMSSRARAVPAYLVWGTDDQENSYLVGRIQLAQWLAMNDLADDGQANLSVPRLPTSVTLRAAASPVPAFTIEGYKDRKDCASVKFATGFRMGHIPDFAWPSVFPSMADFLLGHPMNRAC